VWVNDPGMIVLRLPGVFEHDHFFDPSVRAMLAAPAPITVACSSQRLEITRSDFLLTSSSTINRSSSI
jgi:hypothetical protein